MMNPRFPFPLRGTVHSLLPAVWCTLLLSPCLPLSAQQAGDGRIGVNEDFSRITKPDGWSVTRPPIADLRVEGGKLVIETHILNLPAEMDGTKVTSRTFLKLFKPGTSEVKYDTRNLVGYKSGVTKQFGEVDLDKFHYIIMQIAERPMGLNVEMILEGDDGKNKNVELQVGCSSGLIAQDLKPLGISGKHKVGILLEVFNTGREMKIDSIRLASSLSEQEKAGLLPGPITLPAEKVKRHPYQGLETLWRRAPRSWLDAPAAAEEKALFHDVGTQMPTWRLTATPAHEGLKGADLGGVWRADGSSITTPVRTYDFVKDAWDNKKGTRYWKEQATSAEKYKVEWDKNRKAIIFKEKDPAGKADKVIREHVVAPDRLIAGYELAACGNRLVGAVIGAEVVVVDMVDGQAHKVKVWPLPPIGAKGIDADAKYLSYWAPFLSMHRIKVDLDTGEITDGVHHTMTHGMSGGDYSIMSYDTVSKVVVSAKAREMAVPGKELTLYGVYKTPAETDYGEMTPDCRYGMTNGLRGELAGQYLLFDRLDAGTVLRLCTYNVSYETWDLRAKEDMSPDYTKLAYGSDFLGDADYYMTVIRRPDAPRNLKAAKADGGVKLTWEKPERCKEIRGYNVYRAAGDDVGFVRANKDIITGLEFTDESAGADKPARYLVVGEEFSGLTSGFSNEASAGVSKGPVILHYEAEDMAHAAPMREFADGTASGLRAMRITKVRDDENVGTLALTADVPAKGEYAVWIRARNMEAGKKGTVALGATDKPAAKAEVDGDKWAWLKSSARVAIAPGDKLTLFSADNGLMIDKVVVTGVDGYIPKTADDRKAAPAAVEGLKAAASGPNCVELTWSAAKEADVNTYSVYVGDQADFEMGNQTLLCTTHKTAVADWGIKPGAKFLYKVVAIDRFGNASAPAAAEAATPALDIFTKELPAPAGNASEGMTKGKAGDVQYVEYPGAKAGGQTLGFDFEAPKAGTYHLWIKYTPTFNEREAYDNIGVTIDGKTAPWSTRPRPPRGAKGPGRWFIERLAARKLEAGKHSVVLSFDKKDNLRTNMGQRIAGLWATNDGSFVPPGFILQVMFDKPAPWAMD
ncbi:MAG: hypothetical protein ACE15C_14255 [Phycisphaerae bacterium]